MENVSLGLRRTCNRAVINFQTEIAVVRERFLWFSVYYRYTYTNSYMLYYIPRKPALATSSSSTVQGPILVAVWKISLCTLRSSLKRSSFQAGFDIVALAKRVLRWHQSTSATWIAVWLWPERSFVLVWWCQLMSDVLYGSCGETHTDFTQLNVSFSLRVLRWILRGFAAEVKCVTTCVHTVPCETWGMQHKYLIHMLLVVLRLIHTHYIDVYL